MKIEAGKYYRVRRGDVVGPIQHNEHARDFPWVCLGFVWRKDGSYCELDPHVNDIVAEVYVRDTPPGVYASEAEQDRDVFFNRLGRITEELNLPMDATASRVIEAIRALSDTPPADVVNPFQRGAEEMITITTEEAERLAMILNRLDMDRNATAIRLLAQERDALQADVKRLREALTNAAAVIGSFYAFAETADAVSISGIARCHAMLTSMKKNRRRIEETVMQPARAALGEKE